MIRLPFRLALLAVVTLSGCSTEDDIKAEPVIETGGGAGVSGQGGGSGVGGQGGAGQAGASRASAGGQGGAGQGGGGQAGMSGSSGQGGAGAAGQGGGSGQGGQAVAPEVAFASPVVGAQVENPVAFSLQAQGVTVVRLVADDSFEVPLTWDPVSSATHAFSYTLPGVGLRHLKLSGYLDPAAPAVATAQLAVTVVEPAKSICEGVAEATFQPPETCDKLGGNTTSEVPDNGLFSTSWFGCYRKADGTIYKDPTDNCEFACGSKGLCPSGQSGPECEADLKWFAADADRYGCGSRIRVTNCVNGKAVVLATLDRGPNCKSVEQKYKAPVLDMSHDAMVHLFDGKTYGGSDLKRVVVEKVDAATPLGPVTP